MINEHFNQIWVKLILAHAITLGSSVYYAYPEEVINNRLRWHEQTHVEQYQELGIPKFLGTYIGEFLINIGKGYSLVEAYKNISLEVQALENGEHK